LPLVLTLDADHVNVTVLGLPGFTSTQIKALVALGLLGLSRTARRRKG
jgi:hypothetical protein